MLYEVLKTAKMGAGKAPDLYTAIMAQKMPFAKGSGVEHEYTGAVPVTFTANGQPLLDYLISGNTSQSGTPTPDSPVMPQGTGERTGNLIFSYLDNSSIRTDDGTVISNLSYDLAIAPVIENETYTISRNYDSDNCIYGFFTDIPVRGSVTYNGSRNVSSLTSFTFTAPISGYVAFWSKNDENIRHKSMLNTGSTALPYEPYGIKIPISSTNTTTPVYLGEVESTRRIGKLVLTGQESIGYTTISGNSRFNIENTFQTADYRIGICSHYKYEFVNANNTVYHTSNNTAHTIFIFDNNYTSAADFKAYLAAQYAAGTPVTVWYVLAEPTTGIANEPLHKIGDYADTVSMEQAGAQIPTAKGSTTLDVETTVKPSEVYIKYKS